MRISIRFILTVIILVTAFAAAQEQPIILKTSALLDGQGRVLRDATIVIEGGKITSVGTVDAPGRVYDLRGLTVLPGWIDTHVHITYHFGPNGRAYDKSETKEQAALAAAGNAWATLQAGFTTVQSVGSPDDKDLRNMIASGAVPGPRILTAMEPLVGKGDGSQTPKEIRGFVRTQAAAGADVIKVFASKSIREGGTQTLSQEQLAAACGEASAHGLRALIHAYGPAIRAAALAGCTQIEHGTFATNEDLRLLAARGTYFDPHAGLVIRNYLDNKAHYLGIGNYNETGFAAMEKAMPLNFDLFRRAVVTPNLKIVFGTDAVAGAHGRNAEEFLFRVQQGGQDPMAAMVSANSLAAEALGLKDSLGSIAPGLQADIIALDGNPLEDITAVRRVVFVMKGGKIYKNIAAAHAVAPQDMTRAHD
jgi:imidazolonepropionase-like amidohydrolase